MTHWGYECPNQPPQQQQQPFKRTNYGGVQQSSVQQQLPPSQVKYPGAYGVAPNQMYYHPHQYATQPQQQANSGYQQQQPAEGEQYNYQQFSAPPQPGSYNSEYVPYDPRNNALAGRRGGGGRSFDNRPGGRWGLGVTPPGMQRRQQPGRGVERAYYTDSNGYDIPILVRRPDIAEDQSTGRLDA